MAATSNRVLLDRTTKRPIDTIIRPFQEFAALETSGGLILLAATLAALFWANSPWSGSYTELFTKTYFTIGTGALKLSKPLILWINDGLMAVFFLLVGLEIKREVLQGELSGFKQASLPVAAALGGMILPALIYVLLNPSGPSASGWGIPMATDIAFALGILSLAGRSVPLALKVFLVAFAIVDDLGAVLVIALFYTESINFTMLGLGLGLLAFAFLISRLGVRSLAAYLLLGIPIWVAFLKSGIHATIAGVLLAMAIPLKAAISGPAVHDAYKSLGDSYDESEAAGDGEGMESALTAMADLDRHARSPLVRLEHSLHPLVTWLVMPIFALANAGVPFSEGGSELTGSLSLGIILGLIVGKQVGVFGFAWLAVKSRIASLPEGVNWRHLYGAGMLGGVGFTMSLFIANLAFGEGTLLETSKLAILTASAISGIAGWLLLKSARTST